MDFGFTREQEMLRNMVREFAERELAPRAVALDEKGEFPFDIATKMANLGLLGVCVPKKHGGTEMGALAGFIIVEEISRVYASLALYWGCATEGAFIFEHYGTEEQKKYIPLLCKAEKIFSFGVTEATGGSDPVSMQTTAKLVGDEYIVNGRKVYISLAPIAEVCVFLCKENGKPTALMVEKGTPGFEAGRRENIAGLRAIPIGELIFTDCRIPKKNVVGEEGAGLALALTNLSLVGRPLMSFMALGIAKGAYEVALRYAKERKLYGAPIANLEAIQFMLADMEVEVKAAQWLCYHVGWLIDQGKSSRELAKETAIAKFYATEVARRVAINGMQMLGGYGTASEYHLLRRLHDALEIVAGSGTQEIMRMTIGREITR